MNFWLDEVVVKCKLDMEHDVGCIWVCPAVFICSQQHSSCF